MPAKKAANKPKLPVKPIAKNKTAAVSGKDAAVLLTAGNFINQLKKFQSAVEAEKIQRYFKKENNSAADKFMGVKMGQLFTLAKTFGGMPVKELEKLLESDIHEIRAGAISIMDKESRSKKLNPERHKEMFDLYIKRHDRINNWDLVDLGCLYLTGSYLFNKSRTILYKLAKSKSIWERRTAIVSTCYFIRQGETEDTFTIAEWLVNDKEDLVHKATGWMLRFAGDNEPKKLIAFLDKHAATMPRTLLRYSIEKLDKKKKEYYTRMKSK